MPPKKITDPDDFRRIDDHWITLYLISKNAGKVPLMVFARIVEEYFDDVNYPAAKSNKWMTFLRYGPTFHCEGYWMTKDIKEHVRHVLGKGGCVICSKEEMRFSGLKIA